MEGEREGGNINVWLRPLLGTWPTTQACTLTWNRTSILLIHRMAVNPLSHTSQGVFQPVKARQVHSSLGETEENAQRHGEA